MSALGPPRHVLDSTAAEREFVVVDVVPGEEAPRSRRTRTPVAASAPLARLYVRADLPIEEALGALEKMKTELARSRRGE